MFLCDKCIVKLIEIRAGKPTAQIYGANNTPWRNGDCDGCGKADSISMYPEQSNGALAKAGIIVR